MLRLDRPPVCPLLCHSPVCTGVPKLKSMRRQGDAASESTPSRCLDRRDPDLRTSCDAGSVTRPACIVIEQVHGPRDVGGGRRLLLLSYHFPPDTAAGALRWGRLVLHLAGLGWDADVVTQLPSGVVHAGTAGLRELPSSCRVFGVPAPALFVERVERAALGLRRLIRPRAGQARDVPSLTGAAGPEPESFARGELRHWRFAPRDLFRTYNAWRAYRRDGVWAIQAADIGRALAWQTDYVAVVSSGPPHMVHEGARRVARAIGRPAVLDLRDPWSECERLYEAVASPLWYRLASDYEERCVSSAAAVVMNTVPARDAMRARYPVAAAGIEAITKGYDEDKVLPQMSVNSVFRVAYAGSIYLDRDPRPLFRAAARVIGEFSLRVDALRLEFMGAAESYGGVSLEALAREAGIAEHVTVHPRRSRPEMLKFLAGMAVLVSLPQDSRLAIPSKIFEYMRFPAWLLAMAEPDSATALLLRETAADVVSPNDESRIAQILAGRYREFRAGRRPEPLAGDMRFSRATQAAEFARVLEIATAGRSG